jgi:hypothetical protein
MFELLALAAVIYLFMNRKKKVRKVRGIDAELRELVESTYYSDAMAAEIKGYLLSVVGDDRDGAEKFSDARVAQALYMKMFERACDIPVKTLEEIVKHAENTNWPLQIFFADALKASSRGAFSAGSIGANRCRMKNQPRSAIENGFTSQFTNSVTPIPRTCRLTCPSAPKSIFRSIGTIISQMSAPTGMLTCATAIAPSARIGTGKT